MSGANEPAWSLAECRERSAFAMEKDRDDVCPGCPFDDVPHSIREHITSDEWDVHNLLAMVDALLAAAGEPGNALAIQDRVARVLQDFDVGVERHDPKPENLPVPQDEWFPIEGAVYGLSKEAPIVTVTVMQCPEHCEGCADDDRAHNDDMCVIEERGPLLVRVYRQRDKGGAPDVR